MKEFIVLIIVFIIALFIFGRNLQPGIPPGNETAKFNAGYRILEFQSLSGKRLVTAVWYPTEAQESSYSYGSGGAKGKNAFESSPLKQKFPLVVFSHGFGGCGVQSVFFTEELARHGYIVAAPDHSDAGCSIYQSGEPLEEFNLTSGGFGNPELWNPSFHEDRKEDIELVINEMLKLSSQTDSDFSGVIDENKIGISGHSLGGYTAFAIAGGWASWKDSRVKASLMFSPFIQPFLKSSTTNQVTIPVMYQGGTLDIFITPSIAGENGSYAKSNAPKFFLKIKRTGHMAWSNIACRGYSDTAECIKSSSRVIAINDYGIAFLDKYLKNDSSADKQLNKQEFALETYEHEF